MSKDLPKAFGEAVTVSGTTQLYPLGTKRFQDGKTYVYVKAGSGGLVANEAATVDASDTTGGTFKTAPAAVTGLVIGVSETAIAASSYGWVTVLGAASCKVANGVAAGDVLAANGSTAGVLSKPANTDIVGQRILALEANSSGSTATKVVFLF